MAVAKTIGSALCICLLCSLLASCGHEDYDADQGLADHEHDKQGRMVFPDEGEAAESDASQAVRALSTTGVTPRVGVGRDTVSPGGAPGYTPPTNF